MNEDKSIRVHSGSFDWNPHVAASDGAETGRTRPSARSSLFQCSLTNPLPSLFLHLDGDYVTISHQ